MNLKELKSRWETDEGRERVKNIIKCLKKNKSLENYAGKYLGKWDLRGIKLTSPELEETSVSRWSLVINKNLSEFKSAKLKDIDFSFSDLSYSLWSNCEFENLTMFNTVATNIRCWACHMKNVNIEKTNFSNSLLGGRLKTDSGSFEAVSFKGTNFKGTFYSFPMFRHCLFQDCNFEDLDFDGSRFEDCVFKGKLYSPIFRGITTDYEKRIFWERTINPYDFPNLMKNVDFSEAELIGVAFIKGVDLSTVKLPNVGEYLFLKNIEELFEKAENIISAEWTGEFKRIALGMIEMSYFTKNHKNQKQGIFDKKILIEHFGTDFADKFYGLISSLNNKF